jgi:hypothetical protein
VGLCSEEIVSVVRPVARRRLVETENSSTFATVDYKESLNYD